MLSLKDHLTPRPTTPSMTTDTPPSNPNCAPLVFMLVSCVYEEKEDAVILRGRTADGKSVVVRCEGYVWSFFLQRHTEFEDDDARASFLVRLMQSVRIFESVDVPVRDDPTRTHKCYQKRYKSLRKDNAFRVHAWNNVDGRHRTMYGWTPPEERLQNIMRVWMRKPNTIHCIRQFIDSTQYTARFAADGPARTFNAGFVGVEHQFRLACGITMGGWVRIDNYTEDTSPLVYSDPNMAFRTRYTNVAALPDRVEHAPLRILSFDIECNVRGRFTVAAWSPMALREYLHAKLGVPTKELPTIDNLPRTSDAMRNWVATHKPDLVADLPDENDTDECFLYVAVERILGVDQNLHFNRAQAILYRHPLQDEEIDRSKHPIDRGKATTQSKCYVSQYGNLDVLEVHSELAMLEHIEALVHKWCPDYYTGWNIVTFDLPYLFERYAHLQKCAQPYAKWLPNINLGLKIKGNSYAFPRTKKTNSQGEKLYLAVSTPYIAQVDGMVVWEDIKVPSYKLDDVSESTLEYPKSEHGPNTTYVDRQTGKSVQFPRRKLDLDVTRGGEFWRAGGKKLWMFIVYCYADACLPVQLLEKMGKPAFLIAMARITNVKLGAVFAGQQGKVAGVFARVLDEWEDHLYLVPDWDSHHLHWPEAWAQPSGTLATHFYKGVARFRKVPKGMKGYLGAYNFDPHRGYHQDPILTLDYTSLYPSIVISYCLAYMNFLTHWTIRHYAIPRYKYIRWVVGPKEAIFCGEPFHDDSGMEQQMHDYTTPDLMETFWYHQEDTIMSRVLKIMFGERKVYKNLMAKAKYRVKLIEWRDRAHDSFTVQEMTGLEAYIENKKWIAAFKTAMATAETWAAAIQDALGTWGVGVQNPLLIALGWVVVYNMCQMACKIVLNSAYGFTAPPIAIAMLALMEIAATVTAIGRNVIKRSGRTCESYSIKSLRALIAAEAASMKAAADVVPMEVVEGAPVAAPPTGATPMDWDMFDGESDDFIDCEALEDPNWTPPSAAPYYGGIVTRSGDTDSIMIGIDRDQLLPTETVKDVMDMGCYLAKVINTTMCGMMNLEFEKFSRTTLFNVKKNYIMDLLGEKKLLMKGNASVKRDALPFVKRHIDSMFTTMMRGTEDNKGINNESVEAFKARFCVVVEKLRNELCQVAKGDYSLSDFGLSKKLSKIEYKVEQEHAKVADKIRARGGHVQVGERVRYGYVEHQVVGGVDITDREKSLMRNKGVKYSKATMKADVEDLQTIISQNLPLDIEHYMRKKMKAFPRLLRNLLSPMSNYPHEETYMGDLDRLKKDQEKVEAFQDERVSRFLLGKAEFEFAKKRRIVHETLLERKNVSERQHDVRFMFGARITVSHLCPICSVMFQVPKSEASTNMLCGGCLEDRPKHIEIAMEIMAVTKETRKYTDTICNMCVALQGCEEVTDIEDCRKYSCTIYQERDEANVKRLQTTHKLDVLMAGLDLTDPMAVDY